MINYLKDCQQTTLIGQLPDIINSNNESIKNEFNWIFDSSLNRLTKSVYTPTGSVKAHFGEFTNLACEYITLKNVDSLQNSIQSATENIINKTLNVSSMQIVLAALTNIANSSFIDPEQYDVSALCDISTLIVNHNVLNNRFYNSDFKETNYTHDAESIVYQKTNDASYISVYDVLNNTKENIETIINFVENTSDLINAITENIEILNTSINTIDNSINMINSSIINFGENIEILNTSINTIDNSINMINSSINMVDSSIQDIYTKLYNGIPYIQLQNQPEIIIDPNKYYALNSMTQSILFRPNTQIEDPNIVNEYLFRFKYNSNYTVTLDFGNLYWSLPNGAPVLINTHIYEISIINNLASFIEYV